MKSNESAAIPAPIARASQKWTTTWFLRGVSSRVTRLYVDTFAGTSSAVVTGYPRSGTSWISEVLSIYYGLPCHRHFVAPQFHAQVLHTHDIAIRRMKRVFYMVRDPGEVFISLFVKRFNLCDESLSESYVPLRRLFQEFIQKEVAAPHESPMRWAEHIHQAYERFGADAILRYTPDRAAMTIALARRIAKLDGSCDQARLKEAFSALAASDNKVVGRAPTTKTSRSLKRFDWFDAESAALLTAEFDRLLWLWPEAESLGLTAPVASNLQLGVRPGNVSAA